MTQIMTKVEDFYFKQQGVNQKLTEELDAREEALKIEKAALLALQAEKETEFAEREDAIEAEKIALAVSQNVIYRERNIL